MNKIKQSATVLLCLAILPLVGYAQTDRAVIDKVVATVGGEVILLSEIEEQVSYAKSQQTEVPADFACGALQNIIVTKLLVNQAKLDSIEVKDEEVENQLGARIDRLLSYFDQDENKLAEYYGQTITEIKDQMRNDMRNQLLAERMQGEITGKASVTPAEVQAFYKNIPKDSLPYFNSEVEIKELVYKPLVNETEKNKSRAIAEDLRKRITDGENFAELAKKFSDDTGSGAQGGDLGWQKRGTFVAAFEAMCYNLEKNQVSPLVETEFGFHIIQLLERRGNLVHARHILIKPEITDDDLDMAKAKLDSIKNLIVKDSLPFGIAVKRFGDKEQQSFSNDGRVTNPRSGNTFFEVGDLDTDIFFAIERLKEGEITAPTPFKAPDGSRYFRLIQLQSRSKPHKANLKQDYNKIQTAALEQKKASYTEKWVLDRLRSTFLSVDPLYQTCPGIQDMLNQTN
jgi:peptidyl-prolyl cis-trans isomerase SurA